MIGIDVVEEEPVNMLFNRKGRNMNTIIINGKKTVVSGNSITVSGNSIYVDGKLIEENLSGIVEVKFEGELAELKSESSVTVNGNVHGNVKASGSISCNNVTGNVSASGSVSCNDVNNDVFASGNVSCNSIKGNVTAGGNIKGV